jgi:hypothetical protein
MVVREHPEEAARQLAGAGRHAPHACGSAPTLLVSMWLVWRVGKDRELDVREETVPAWRGPVSDGRETDPHPVAAPRPPNRRASASAMTPIRGYCGPR